jgi:hypothetical protein
MNGIEILGTMLMLSGAVTALVGFSLMHAKFIESINEEEKIKPMTWLSWLDFTGNVMILETFRRWNWKENKSHPATFFIGIGISLLGFWII